MEHPTNPQVAIALEELAEQLDFIGRRYPARAYRRAAASIRRLPVSVGALAMSGRTQELRGIGSSIEARIVELCQTGRIEDLERLRERTPVALLLLTRMPGVGRKVAEAIWEELHPRTLEELEELLVDGRLREVRGVGPVTEDAIRAALLQLETEPEEAAAPMLRTHARRAADDVVALLRGCVPDLLRVHVTGDLARGAELVEVLDLVVVADDAPVANSAVRAQLDGRGWHTVREDSPVADECMTFALRASTGAGVRIHVTDPANEARSVLHATGPDAHVQEVEALLAGADVPPREGDEPADGPAYRAAGIARVPPELRHRPDAIEAARSGSLPQLVRVEDLRGDLHVHSTWSDGRASILEMARAAVDRGYDHLCITDHSWSLRIVGGLAIGDLAEQWRELERIRPTLPDGFELLQGTEMEILPDGSLDYPDEVLERLDWVVASIHSRQRQPAEEITRRMERAMRNPLVDCIGHPTSRLLLRRRPTELDVDRLIELAAETGTFLEINASPDRLDLCSEQAASAARAGVGICIHSDAHGPETLGLVEHGVAIARRAGLTADQVANARPWRELRELQPRWRA